MLGQPDAVEAELFGPRHLLDLAPNDFGVGERRWSLEEVVGAEAHRGPAKTLSHPRRVHHRSLEQNPTQRRGGLMRCGYFAMPLHPPGADPARTMEEDLEQLVTLDRLGFEEAWIGEHFTAMWENIPCPDLFIAKALALTQTMKLGTGVSCLPNHSPLMLAQRIAQLDQMARGRFYWGVGSGGFPGDFEVVGVDPKSGEQREITRAVLDLILELWNDPKPSLYESKYWRFRIPEPQEDIGLRLHLRPYQRPHPPIGVAGVSAKSETLVLAGERGYIPMSINFVPPRILRTHWDAVAAGAQRVGG